MNHRPDAISRMLSDRFFKKPKGKAMVSMLLFHGARMEQIRAAIDLLAEYHRKSADLKRRMGDPREEITEAGPLSDVLAHFNTNIFSSPILPLERVDELALLEHHFERNRKWNLDHIVTIARHWPGVEAGVAVVKAFQDHDLSPALLNRLGTAQISPLEFARDWSRLRRQDASLTPETLAKNWNRYRATLVPVSDVSLPINPISAEPEGPKPPPESPPFSGRRRGKGKGKQKESPSKGPSPQRSSRPNRSALLAQLNEELKTQGLDAPLAKLLGSPTHEIQAGHLFALQPAARLEPAQQVRFHALRVFENLRNLPLLRDATAIQVAQHTHGTRVVDPHHLRMLGEAAEKLNAPVEDVVEALMRHSMSTAFDRESQQKLVERIRRLERTSPEASVFRPRITNAVARSLRPREG